jgi:hypothetical protein
MSLINDALRRAKEAQQQTPSIRPPELPFRPVEPAQQSARRGLGLLLPVALGAVALLVLLFGWAWTHARVAGTPIEVNARTAIVSETAAPAPAPAVKPAPTQKSVFISVPTAGTAASLAAHTADAAADNPPVNVEESKATNAPALVPPPPPKPAPLRLQAIVFNPKRPSAMISGKTLFIGDKLGDQRVVAIDKDSVTLAGAGQTKVLSLAE